MVKSISDANSDFVELNEAVEAVDDLLSTQTQSPPLSLSHTFRHVLVARQALVFVWLCKIMYFVFCDHAVSVLLTVRSRKAAHHSGLQQFSELTDIFCKNGSTMQGLRQSNPTSNTTDLACLSIEKIFSQLLHNRKKPSDEKIIVNFLDAIAQKESVNDEFLAADLVSHAVEIQPFFDPSACPIYRLRQAFEVLCKNFSVDEDDPVNVDDEDRPMVKLMGSTSGLKVVEAARAMYKKRKAELSLSLGLDTIETDVKKMIDKGDDDDDDVLPLSDQKESIMKVHESLKKVQDSKKNTADRKATWRG